MSWSDCPCASARMARSFISGSGFDFCSWPHRMRSAAALNALICPSSPISMMPSETESCMACSSACCSSRNPACPRSSAAIFGIRM